MLIGRTNFSQQEETFKQILNKAWRASETLAYELGSRTKAYLQTPKSVEENGQGTQFWVPHLRLTNPRAFGAFLWFMYGQPQRWPKTNRLQRFSTKMSLHDWQLGVCNHGAICKSLDGKGRRRLLQLRKEAGRAGGSKKPQPYIGWTAARKEEESFSFLLALLSSQGVAVPPMVSLICLMEVFIC